MNWVDRMITMLRAQKRMTKICAAWSEETKQKIVDEQKERGSELVEHEETALLDLSLWCYSGLEVYGIPLYSVAINSAEYSPFEMDLVKTKIPAEKLQGYKEIVNNIVNILSVWIDKYGGICIGSSDMRKFEAYSRIR